MVRPHRIVVLTALAACLAAPASAVTLVPANFTVDDVAPGAAFNTPVAIAYLPGGRLLVAEKRGRVYAVVNGVKNPTPMWSRENEVLNVDDRGLLGLAVDPNYLVNHFVYLMYTVDPDSNGTDNNDDAFGRLVRYQVSASDSNLLDPASRTVLFGASWRQGPLSASPSHTIGALRFGRDGSLLVSVGDGAQFNSMDQGGQDPNAFGATRTDPYEDIGAFRSQYIGSLCGKVLRIDPATGRGYPSNPYYDGNTASIRSRVWVYGLRNPYRFCVRPGTGSANPANGQPGTVYLGDVGWDTYEEANIARTGGKNFGWPCYEGFGLQPAYSAGSPAHGGCDSIGSFNDPTTISAPLMAWHHSNASLGFPGGFTGNTSIGGVWYTGTRYPAEYRNTYFFGDYGQNWIRCAIMDSLDQLVALRDFASVADGPVDFTVEPGSGDLVYVSINSGQVRRIRFTGTLGNTPPIAAAAGAPDVGVAPLSVNFSSAGTNDPDNDPITLSWNFGDAQGSTVPNPTHVYTSAGTYHAVLSVTDTSGAVGRDTVVVIVASSSTFPTTGVLDNFNRPDGPIGGSWTGDTNGLIVTGNQLGQNCCYATTAWDGAIFGPDQEAYVTFNQVTPSAFEHDVLLKVQGTSTYAGHIEVRWDPSTSTVTVDTYDPATTWVNWLTLNPVTFQAGDQFGGRAFSNGTVQVFKNGVVIGTTAVNGWAYAGAGGRLGLTLYGALSSRLDQFGGGNTVINSNTPPHATLTSPIANSFYFAGQVIVMSGGGSDGQDPPAALEHHWEVDIHHNNHIHPNSIVSDSATASFVAVNHDDGTGVFLGLRHIVTDTGGLSDTARASIFPEVDLTPSPLTLLPSTPGTTAPATWRFAIRDLGRMPAPISHWRLLVDGTVRAEGDTIVPALDSVVIARTLPPALAAGAHVARVVVDTLATVVETSESNNGLTRSVTVVTGPGPDEMPPLFTHGPTAQPSGVIAFVDWANDEPTTGVVRFGATPALGDSTAAPADTAHHVVLEGLALGTRYYFVALATDTAGNRASAPMDSFVTLSGPLAVAPPPVRFALSSGYPNPSRSSVAFALELPAEARVEFAVVDLAGREVWRAPSRAFGAGRWTLTWSGAGRDGGRLSPGLYLARLRVDGRDYVRRLTLLR